MSLTLLYLSPFATDGPHHFPQRSLLSRFMFVVYTLYMYVGFYVLCRSGPSDICMTVTQCCDGKY